MSKMTAMALKNYPKVPKDEMGKKGVEKGLF